MGVYCLMCQTENSDQEITCQYCGAALSTIDSSGYYLKPKTTLKAQRYTILNILGEGGFGITYRGLDQTNRQEVAIKEYWPDKAARQGTTVIWPHSISPRDRQEQTQKFAAEASLLARFRHPHIVEVYDWFEDNNTTYIAMALIQGKTLLKLLEQEGPLPETRVRNYFIQMGQALQAIHTVNLLHRDIKPENIILDGHDRAILIDFGSAREFVAGKTGKMTAFLTPGYAPIEQYATQSRRTAATDLYALCASMYELLTGEVPLAATERMLSDRLVAPRQIVPAISQQMEDILMKGLRMRCEERFQTADELLQTLGYSPSSSPKVMKLIARTPAAPMSEFLVKADQVIVGRFTAAEPDTINLDNFPGSDTVSRRHAAFYREGNQWKVKDLGSANGVFIKPANHSSFKARITAPETLNSGDEIAFGKIRFRIQFM